MERGYEASLHAEPLQAPSCVLQVRAAYDLVVSDAGLTVGEPGEFVLFQVGLQSLCVLCNDPFLQNCEFLSVV